VLSFVLVGHRSSLGICVHSAPGAHGAAHASRLPFLSGKTGPGAAVG
jgi:hypothetical protein